MKCTLQRHCKMLIYQYAWEITCSKLYISLYSIPCGKIWLNTKTIDIFCRSKLLILVELSLTFLFSKTLSIWFDSSSNLLFMQKDCESWCLTKTLQCISNCSLFLNYWQHWILVVLVLNLRPHIGKKAFMQYKSHKLITGTCTCCTITN